MSPGLPQQAISSGITQALVTLVPLAAAAVLASLLAGYAASRLGLRDPTLSLVARWVGVVLVVWLLWDKLAGEWTGWTHRLWSGLADVSGGGPWL